MEPRLHLAGMRVVLLVQARRLPAAEVCHKLSDQIEAELGAVDHLYEEAMGDNVKRLRHVARGACVD